jgi:hypothetical protein
VQAVLVTMHQVPIRRSVTSQGLFEQ